MGFVYCDWDKEPPQGNWDIARRASLELILLCEKKLAELKRDGAGFPHDLPPAHTEILRLMEKSRDVKRWADNIDLSLDCFRESDLVSEEGS